MASGGDDREKGPVLVSHRIGVPEEVDAGEGPLAVGDQWVVASPGRA